LAFLTKNIIKAISIYKDLGVPFMSIKKEYYEDLKNNIKGIDKFEDFEKIKNLDLLIDGKLINDKLSYLLQNFTLPLQDYPTFYLEFIQRDGEKGKFNFLKKVLEGEI
jgi:4-hydroxyphenylpyruvate dioxygenase